MLGVDDLFSGSCCLFAPFQVAHSTRRTNTPYSQLPPRLVVHVAGRVASSEPCAGQGGRYLPSSRKVAFCIVSAADRKPAIHPTAAAPASPVPVSQHCRRAYSCSSTAARPPPSLRVSAPPQELRLAPHIAPHTTSTSAASPKPQALQPQASSLTHAPRLATAHPDPHAWRPLSLHVTCKRHALSSLLPLPHRLTHTAPRKPLQ